MQNTRASREYMVHFKLAPGFRPIIISIKLGRKKKKRSMYAKKEISHTAIFYYSMISSHIQ